ncbi:hypothetical protein T07_12517 [Trichinella nelsoni]|uniref:Uncharacterized protein n=1 Tax=Trichinella nelsoni TaxID=6336 RepID=A0A0V0RUU5_9BILA|nr:hypothetical protein T07_12517 [Trichinella nelsoni]
MRSLFAPRSQLNVWSSGGTNSASVTSDNTTPASDRPHAKRAANRHLRDKSDNTETFDTKLKYKLYFQQHSVSNLLDLASSRHIGHVCRLCGT